MMTKKLFAIVALVGGAGLGACETADAVQQQAKPPAAAPAPAPDPAPAMAAPAPTPVKPRTLANGRPACGNVQSRMAMPCPPEPAAAPEPAK